MEINTDFNSPIKALDCLVELQKERVAQLEQNYRAQRGTFQIECVRKAFYQFLPGEDHSVLDYAAYERKAEQLRLEIEGEREMLVSLLSFREHLPADGDLISHMNGRYRLFPTLQENGR